jgi:hypothetical protein
VTFYRAQRITSFKSAARLQLLHKYIIEVLLQARFNSRNTNLTTLADAFTSLDIYTPGRNSDRSLQRGQQHEALIKHLRALRTYESAHLDGAWILGDVRTGSNTPYGKRLRRLGVLGGKTIRTQSLAFHGSETSVSPDSEPCPYLSNMHINVPSVPGMVVFSPSHNPGAVRKGFRDPLMYHIQVSFADIDRTCYSLLTVLIAPTPLHAVSCACQKPHRGSRTLEESRGEWNKV